MEIKMNIRAKTDIRGRRENQDSLLIDEQVPPVESDSEYNLCIDSTNGEVHLIAVADGVGGADYGKQAAKIALRKIKGVFDKAINNDDFDTFTDLAQRMMNEANIAVAKLSELLGEMGTTLSFIIWSNLNYCVANIGDSPIYIQRNEKLIRYSTPHTEGYLMSLDGKKATKRSENRLINYIGHPELSGSEMMECSEGELQAGDVILLCSDGLTRVIKESKVEKLINTKRFPDLMSCIWKELEKKEKGDNCTVVLIEVSVNNDVHTELLKGRLNHVKNDDELEKYWDRYGELSKDWKFYISNKIKRSGLKKSVIKDYIFEGLANVPDWLKDDTIPANRDYIAFLGIACGFSREEIDEMLQKASFSKLYSKDIHDAVLIFMIEQRVWNRNGQKTIKALFTELEDQAYSRQDQLNREEMHNGVSTSILDMFFRRRNLKLLEMVEEVYRNNAKQYSAFFDQITKLQEKNGNVASFHCSDAARQKYYRAFRELQKEHKIPNRIMLIAIAVQLDASLETTDSLLKNAGMSELYSKDPVEHLIRYYLKELSDMEPSSDEMILNCPAEYINVAEYLYVRLEKYMSDLSKQARVDAKFQERKKQIEENVTYQKLMSLLYEESETI